MPFQIIQNDITRVHADVIVNTANPHPVIGNGTDSAVYAAAGREQLLAARRNIGELAPGSVAATPAFQLPARYIIHTVGPVWTDGNHGERDILRACYARSMALADELDAQSMAFPLIATGVYAFPKEEALGIALSEIGRFLLGHDMMIFLVVFDRTSFALSGALLGEISTFIGDHDVHMAALSEYGAQAVLRERRIAQLAGSFRNAQPDTGLPGPSKKPVLPEETESLEEVLNQTGSTFQEKLMQLIRESGLDDVTVYKRANLDRKVFSKIRCRKDYRPSKKTAVALAIALHLDMPAMLDLLARAGIAFSPSSKFDLIITFFVTHGIHDIYEINAALFQYGQPLLGA